MEVLDCRRLTGPNVIWDHPGAVLDIACDDDQAGELIAALADRLEGLLAAVGWAEEGLAARKCSGGISLAVSAPLDALYAATEILEAAWALHIGKATGGEDALLVALRNSIAQERNPRLIDLLAAARAKSVSCLVDDDEVSLGLGRHSRSWAASAVPTPRDVDWAVLCDIPVGLITGTNGKTTSSRLVANMAAAAGKTCGLTSTDWMAVGSEIIDEGDYAGPGGARTVLRHQQVEIAILETARGGLLRRGLAVEHADAALITNISEDHLGDFGSRSLAELLDIKWVVARALDDERPLVINADDPLLVARAENAGKRLCFFSPDADAPALRSHFAEGGSVTTVIDGEFARGVNGEWTRLARVADVPITFGGAAQHNVANALGAIGLANALGLADDAIRRGLLETRRGDNPGRCNLYEVDGVKVLVDFAHNVEAMHALFHLAHKLPAKRRLLCFGQAGDRPDSAIESLAESAWAIGLDLVVISELEKYYRGREAGEVFDIMSRALRKAGATSAQIEHCPNEMASLRLAMKRAERGDLVIMLALADATEIRAWLKDKEQHEAA